MSAETRCYSKNCVFDYSGPSEKSTSMILSNVQKDVKIWQLLIPFTHPDIFAPGKLAKIKREDATKDDLLVGRWWGKGRGKLWLGS